MATFSQNMTLFSRLRSYSTAHSAYCTLRERRPKLCASTMGWPSPQMFCKSAPRGKALLSANSGHFVTKKKQSNNAGCLVRNPAQIGPAYQITCGPKRQKHVVSNSLSASTGAAICPALGPDGNNRQPQSVFYFQKLREAVEAPDETERRVFNTIISDVVYRSLVSSVRHTKPSTPTEGPYKYRLRSHVKNTRALSSYPWP